MKESQYMKGIFLVNKFSKIVNHRMVKVRIERRKELLYEKKFSDDPINSCLTGWSLW